MNKDRENDNIAIYERYTAHLDEMAENSDGIPKHVVMTKKKGGVLPPAWIYMELYRRTRTERTPDRTN